METVAGPDGMKYEHGRQQSLGGTNNSHAAEVRD
jgi:hypothetical protein